jgi:hypothetical protein
LSDKKYPQSLYTQTWRKNHPDRYNAEKRRANAKNRAEIGSETLPRRDWTDAEIEEILSPDRPTDSDTSKKIKRTVLAIEAKRARLLKAMEKAELAAQRALEGGQT